MIYEECLDNVYALDARTGAIVWVYSGGSSSSPAVGYGLVYVGSEDLLYALNAASGEVVWEFQAPGGMTTPAVANGIVYVSGGAGYLYALDARTGTQLWSYKIGDLCETAITVVNGVVYASSCYPSKLYAFSLKHGAN